MNRSTRGIGVYLIALVLVVLLLFGMRGGVTMEEKCTYNEFVQALEEGTVAAADLRQNTEVPTGEVVLTMSDGSIKQVYVTDVREAEELLRC